ncbi:hypothetical protein R1sor_017166 [Riccia sorocarpa]|uniref:Uncharacterized protein n=1 Tax=Riccia sorocarpa TaxID=122646 RepID=A0ABD3I7V0_9MARC
MAAGSVSAINGGGPPNSAIITRAQGEYWVDEIESWFYGKNETVIQSDAMKHQFQAIAFPLPLWPYIGIVKEVLIESTFKANAMRFERPGMAASSQPYRQSKTLEGQEDFSTIAQMQQALRGEIANFGARSVRVTMVGIGHNGAVYRGCPTYRISERRGCGHAYGIAEWLFRLKMTVKDASGELDVAAWETAKQILGMDLDEFVAVHVRAESNAVLRRLVGSHWILSLSIQRSERENYAKVDRTESVTKKQLFPENSLADGERRSTDAMCTPARMVVPAFSFKAGVTSDGGIASTPTRREGERMDLKSGIRNPHFRSVLFLGFCVGLLTRGLVYIVALDAHAV